MDVSTLLTVAQTLLQLLDSSIMREIENIWSFNSQLEKIKSTMTTIQAVLLDAQEQERQQVPHNHVDCDWLEKLRFIVYQADNLFDHILTIAHQRKFIMDSHNSTRASSTALWLFLSRPTSTYKISLEMKKIREKLDGFAKDRRDFGSSYSRQVVSVSGSKVGRRRLESHSFVRDKDVIGRDVDRSKVVDMLLDSRVDNVSFVSIIGIGGLGKTTLAQLVYNDERIKKEFPLKFWICVGEDFDVKVILAKILGLGRKVKNDDLAMDELQSELHEKIVGKKYLLVLDDVWNEHRQEWLNLENLLLGGGKGSRILVTTRSRKVAKIIGKNRGYELKGLSEEDSWNLFERTAFEEKELIDSDLVDIGKEIVQKCANVPLAIKTVGSLLYHEGESTWRSVKNVDLANIQQTQNGIIPILKLSYYHLTYALKSCLNYCILFPKDFELQKETLMYLWIAQGYIHPLDSQSVEDMAEEYFMTLMHRCFLEPVKVDDHDEILTCKIHDLMHEVVREVAGAEFLVAKTLTSQFSEKMHHISIEDLNLSRCFPTMKGVRTFLHFQHGDVYEPFIDLLLSNGKYLRVLDLHHSRIKCLPRKIGELLHLRYLDISHNSEMEVLPSSITKLYNLQTLKLSHCHSLKTLPSNFRKLVTLRHLDISHCYGLTHMPPKMNSLTCLRRLTMFVLGESSHSYRSKQVWLDQLEHLRALTELKGDLTIRVQKGSSCKQSASKIRKTRYLMSTKYLKELCIEWASSEPEESDEDEALLESLEPHFKIKSFELTGFPSTRFQMWASLDNLGTQPIQLVRISLKNCKLLGHLPPLSRLQHLKILEICSLESLEYVDDARQTIDGHLPFFPSLEILRLDNLPRLKGWSLSIGFSVNNNELLLPSLPCLTELLIWDCPHLAYIPLCPNVEKLNMRRFKDSLLEIVRLKEIKTDDPHSSLQSSSPSIKHQQFLHELNSLPIEFDENQFSWVKITESNLETLSRLEDVFERCALSSLIRSLEISSCWELKSLSGGGLEHLTALERLRLAHLPVLDLNSTEGEQNKNTALWGSLENLQVLVLDTLPKLVKLPNEMQCLTALQSLRISFCKNLSVVPEWIGCLKFLEFLHIDCCQELKSLPESMRNLASLRRLEIWQCSADLTERCRGPTGEDWPNIRHIPIFSIHTC